jgi:sulfatase maturation enzyme AslB (radical SAM superfamily)
MPSTLEEGEKDYFSLIDFTKHNQFLDLKCVECPLLPACATCCAHNYFSTGTLNSRPYDMCRFRQVELYVAAILWGMMLHSPEKYVSTRQQSAEQRALIATGILEIQKAYVEGKIMV